MTASPRFVLVRHGPPVIHRDVPSPAWELDHDQASLVRDLADGLPPAGVIATSDEPKALATAEVIRDRVGGELRVDERLREVGRPPRWDDDYVTTASRYLAAGAEPGWEDAEAVIARVAAGIHASPPGSIIVDHGLAMTLYATTRHPTLDPVAFWRDLRLPDAWWIGGDTPERIGSATVVRDESDG